MWRRQPSAEVTTLSWFHVTVHGRKYLLASLPSGTDVIVTPLPIIHSLLVLSLADRSVPFHKAGVVVFHFAFGIRSCVLGHLVTSLIAFPVTSFALRGRAEKAASVIHSDEDGFETSAFMDGQSW